MYLEIRTSAFKPDESLSGMLEEKPNEASSSSSTSSSESMSDSTDQDEAVRFMDAELGESELNLEGKVAYKNRFTHVVHVKQRTANKFYCGRVIHSRYSRVHAVSGSTHVCSQCRHSSGADTHAPGA